MRSVVRNDRADIIQFVGGGHQLHGWRGRLEMCQVTFFAGFPWWLRYDVGIGTTFDNQGDSFAESCRIMFSVGCPP